jgi:Sec7 domain
MLHHITSHYHDTSHLTHTPHTMHTGTISADLRVEDEEVSGVGIKLEESPSGTAAELAKGSIVGNFDRKQKAQEEIETGILKFNQSSKKGIAFLVERGHVEMTPKSVALFLRQYSEKLDKTAVGEYLGREREYEGGFCLKVLHEFVDSMDFGGMAFDLAIRYFLAGFRLPGEAQKIDRLMEDIICKTKTLLPPRIWRLY